MRVWIRSVVCTGAIALGTESGLNGLFSEIYAVNFSTTILTLSPYPAWSPAAPIGPAGSFFSMGPVAALGMTQADLLQRFLAAADLSPSGTDEFGKFLFSYELAPGEYSTGTLGDVVPSFRSLGRSPWSSPGQPCSRGTPPGAAPVADSLRNRAFGRGGVWLYVCPEV